MICDTSQLNAHEGIEWRSLDTTDATALFELAARIEIADATAYRTSPEECAAVLVPAAGHQIVGAFTKSGQLVGYALLRIDKERNEAECSGGIDPRWRGHGMGQDALAWQTDRARSLLDPNRPWRVTTHVDEARQDLIDLLYRRGFIPREGYLEVSRSLGRILPRVPRRAFTEVIPWDHRYDVQVRGLWNRLAKVDESQFVWEDYPANMVDSCSIIALDTSADRPKVIGFARTFVYPQDSAALGHTEGYVNEFLVEPQIGLETVGRAILVAAMRACANNDLDAISGGISNTRVNTIKLLKELKFTERGRLRCYELTNEAAASGSN